MAAISQARDFFQRVQRHPNMHGSGKTYREAASFINGYDAAHGYDLLAGLNEWMALKAGSGSNLVWFAQVLRMTFPEEERPGSRDRTPEEERMALETLYRMLDQFLEEREAGKSVDQIKAEHSSWIEASLARRDGSD